MEQYTTSQMTSDLRRLRLKGLIFRPPRTNRYRHALRMESGAAVVRIGGVRLPADNGEVHRERRRAAVSAALSTRSRGLPTRPAHLRRLPSPESRLKTCYF